MAEHNWDVKNKCIKYTLLCITTLLVLLSTFIITVGTRVYAIYHYIVFFLYFDYFTDAIFTIIIGAVILILSLFGFFGALKESIRLVNWFTVMLCIVLVVEVCVAIMALHMREEVYYMLTDSLQSYIPEYYQRHKTKEAFDIMQSGLHCCGLNSYEDWKNVPPPDGVSGVVYGNLTLPKSCCGATSTNFYDFEVFEECTMLNANGCLFMVNNLMYETAVLLGAVALTVAIIQIIGIVVSSFSLVKSIRRAIVGRKDGELQEQLINRHSSIDSNEEKKAPFVFRLLSIGPFSLVCTKDLY